MYDGMSVNTVNYNKGRQENSPIVHADVDNWLIERDGTLYNAPAIVAVSRSVSAQDVTET